MKYEDGTTEEGYELNQYENAAAYVRQGHTPEDAAAEWSVEASILVKFMEVNGL